LALAQEINYKLLLKLTSLNRELLEEDKIVNG